MGTLWLVVVLSVQVHIGEIGQTAQHVPLFLIALYCHKLYS